MKTLRLILIISIIGYCFTQTEEVDCGSIFEGLVKEKCEAMGSCSYNSFSGSCLETHACTDGNEKSASICRGIVPPNFNSSKCVQVGTNCQQTPKECSDWNLIGNGNSITGDNCTLLNAPTNQRCLLVSETSGTPATIIQVCKAHHKLCTTINTNTNSECTNNIPENPAQKCSWTEGDSTPCKAETRYCDDANQYYKSKIICPTLTISDSTADKDKKKCIYNGGICKSEYILCSTRSVSNPSECENYTPLKDNDYDYTQICTHDETITPGPKCKARKRKCDEYDYISNSIPTDLLNEDLCGQLEASKGYKRCAYNEEDNECYEEYRNCEDYITNKVETDRSGCESIVLTDKTKKCVYITEEDKCVTRDIYSNCEDYTGKDKKICESIVLAPYNRPFCILDKDTKCIERPLFCSEAFSEDDCLKRAKASENNKKCAYDTVNNKCYEEYLRCEDYLETNSTECLGIKLYDGKTCKYETSTNSNLNTYRCRSNYKKCSEANTKEECKLISKTGVTDTERKICDYDEDDGECIETFKYCSDYRKICTGTDNSCKDFCEKKIKPYDESGENIDISSKCNYEAGVGCQRVPVECKDAGSNPILCETFSQYIKDKDKKYCVFYGGTCTIHYKKCEDYEYSTDTPTCEGNIIEGYKIGACRVNSSNYCVEKKDCSLFTRPSSFTAESPTTSSKFYTELCESINPNCTYSINAKCIFEEKKCSDTKFYSDNENNKEICENMKASEPYKKCVLKEDKSGCKEIYRELDFSTAYISYTPPDNTTQGNSSGFIRNGIHLIIALLVLLI